MRLLSPKNMVVKVTVVVMEPALCGMVDALTVLLVVQPIQNIWAAHTLSNHMV